jgi:5'-deoxynucleotidase YfbR-like HD superfamily hydrolase
MLVAQSAVLIRASRRDLKTMSQDASKAYIATYTGKQFFLLAPRMEDIDIVDIAHALAMQCRWTGHCKFHYSVAQHAYYCSLLGTEEEALERLNHDDSEAYISDMNRPLKHYTKAGEAYMKVEEPLQHMIYEAFACKTTEPASVKVADNLMLYAEKAQIMGYKFSEAELWSPQEEQAPIIIEQWSPEKAERKFLERFNELYKRRIN